MSSVTWHMSYVFVFERAVTVGWNSCEQAWCDDGDCGGWEAQNDSIWVRGQVRGCEGCQVISQSSIEQRKGQESTIARTSRADGRCNKRHCQLSMLYCFYCLLSVVYCQLCNVIYQHFRTFPLVKKWTACNLFTTEVFSSCSSGKIC